jgi:1-acyl-sn-glycerol-3-phosphate acyltransferase
MRGDMRGVERQQRKWGEGILRAAGARLTVFGAENIDAKRPYVVVSNHASLLDPPALFAALPIGMTYVAKIELLAVPVFGAIIGRTGAVFVPRTDHDRSHQAMQLAAKRVREGQNVLVFAEGTRSRDGRLQPFKKGAFVLAIAAGADILPVTIRGSHALMPAHGNKIRSGPLEVHIHPPIRTAGLEYSDREQLRLMTQAAVASLMPAN